ncbi:14668_t:CDS:1, partial [Gigaspora rosea]
RRHYNLPSLSEVAVILPGGDSAPDAMRNIILRLREDPLEHIHEGHPAYLLLHYMLFFLFGDLGWNTELQQTLIDNFGQSLNDQSEAPRLTQMAFYSFHLFSRSTKFSLILWGGK